MDDDEMRAKSEDLMIAEHANRNAVFFVKFSKFIRVSSGHKDPSRSRTSLRLKVEVYRGAGGNRTTAERRRRTIKGFDEMLREGKVFTKTERGTERAMLTAEKYLALINTSAKK